MSLRPANPHLLSELEPFFVATPDNAALFDRRPFGLVIADDATFDPLRRDAAPFLRLLGRLDEVTFGVGGMPMPRWVFFDGAELPGGIVGFARRAERISDAARALLRVPEGYRGLVPFAMYIAVPTHQEGTWMGHNLASVAGLLPDEPLRGLGSLTKAVGLRVYRARAQLGATQWDSAALRLHVRLGPLCLLTAWTPAHSEPRTLTYKVPIDADALRHLAWDPAGRITYPTPELFIESDDARAMQALQRRIEAGEHFVVAGRPEVIGGGRQRVPVAGGSGE